MFKWKMLNSRDNKTKAKVGKTTMINGLKRQRLA